MSEIGLEKFSFQSPDELSALLRNLITIDRNTLMSSWEIAHEKVAKNYSPQAQLESYTRILDSCFNEKKSSQESKDLIPVATFFVPEPVIKFRFYWRQKRKRIIGALRKMF
jgi:hypothetical protein